MSTTLVPGFVVGFVAMALVRTIGDATLRFDGRRLRRARTRSAWTSLTKDLGDFWASQVLLGTAMAAVGLNTNFSVFKGVGLKPFVVGMAGALVVGVVGLLMAMLLGPVRPSLVKDSHRDTETQRSRPARLAAALRAVSRMIRHEK